MFVCGNTWHSEKEKKEKKGASTMFRLQKFPSEGDSPTALSSRANTSIFKNCDFNLQNTELRNIQKFLPAL